MLGLFIKQKPMKIINKAYLLIFIAVICLLFLSVASQPAKACAGCGTSCTYHAYRNCYGNGVYWFDSCGNVQDLYQICAGSQKCQYGQCVVRYIPIPVPAPKPVAPPEPAPAPTPPLPTDTTDNNIAPFSISFSARQNQNTEQWQKTASIGANSAILFRISAVNNSGDIINDINISTNIPSKITSIGKLQVDEIPFSGDIISGINIGQLAPGTAKIITFEGKTQGISQTSSEQAVATITALNIMQTDSVLINFTQSPASVAQAASTQAASGFLAFLKRWYLWILVGLVLIVLFVIVFRRLSSNI